MVAIGAYLVPTALALLTGGVPLQEGTVAQLRGVTEVSGLVQGCVSAPSSIPDVSASRQSTYPPVRSPCRSRWRWRCVADVVAAP